MAHKWIFPNPDWERPKWKDIKYDYYPSLDKDVITTQKNLVNAEETLGEKFE